MHGLRISIKSLLVMRDPCRFFVVEIKDVAVECDKYYLTAAFSAMVQPMILALILYLSFLVSFLVSFVQLFEGSLYVQLQR